MSTSESGFGPRLRHAQDILSYISGFPGYNPPRAQESAAGFSAFLADLVTINADETAQLNAYTMAVSQRQLSFNGPDGINKLLAPIVGAVQSQFGKTSIEYKTVANIVRRMRTTKLIRPPVDPAHPEEALAISSSEKSYGSMTHFFNRLKTSLAGFTGYNPSNAGIKLLALDTLAASLTVLSNAVAAALLSLKNARSIRLEAYADLKERVQRIKAYVKAQYGTGSNEFKLIKGIKV